MALPDRLWQTVKSGRQTTARLNLASLRGLWRALTILDFSYFTGVLWGLEAGQIPCSYKDRAIYSILPL